MPLNLNNGSFRAPLTPYEDTLNKAVYIDKLVYHAPSTSKQENKNKNRQRNVIWFNQPYSKSVTSRISQSVLYLIDIHFPKNHTFNKIINRNKNKVKVNYSCMQNIKSIINNQNMNILHQNNKIKDECNCRNKYCPLGGKCLSPDIVYQGKITSTQPNYNDKVYFGVAEKSFKDSTIIPNPLPMKITQMSQKLKGGTLFQK